MISSSCYRSQTSNPSKKIHSKAAANHPRSRCYHHLGAKAGSGRAVGVISSSCRRYQTSNPSYHSSLIAARTLQIQCNLHLAPCFLNSNLALSPYTSHFGLAPLTSQLVPPNSQFALVPRTLRLALALLTS